jgi:hypothetical protein
LTLGLAVDLYPLESMDVYQMMSLLVVIAGVQAFDHHGRHVWRLS